MHLVTRLLLILAALPIVPVRGELQSEYRQADTNDYLRSDLFKADPAACVITPAEATNIGGSYLINTRPHPPKVIYLQETHDWLEPITPPDMPASLNCPPDEMQVREPQGSVQVALPTAPATFIDVRSGMVLPNGSVLRTGDASSVAVLFGGVDSVRLAPGTHAAVQMNLAGGLRDVEVDIRGGMVFSKVGQRLDEKEAYAVHTPFGVASAHGTDYVTVVLPRRVDVWVAQGTVALIAPDGARQVTVSTGSEPLKVMRQPVAPNDEIANVESAESLTALLDFIPMANQKLKALAARSRSGDGLTATEKDYIGRIRQVTALIRLATPDALRTPAPVPIAPVALAPLPPRAKPAPVAWNETNYPKAKPVLVPPVTPMTAAPPAVAATPSSAPTAGAKATPGAAMPPTAKQLAQSPSRHKHPAAEKKDPALARLAPPPDAAYPRATPVDSADLIAAPTVMGAPPPAHAPGAPKVSARPAADNADPNSLNAQINPFHTVSGIEPAATMPPVPPVTLRDGDSTSGPSAPLDSATSR